jgi:uncharacterized membrane protein
MKFALDFSTLNFSVKTLALRLSKFIIITHGFFPRRGVVIQNYLGSIEIALIPVMAGTALIVIFFQSRLQSRLTPGLLSFFRQPIWQGSQLIWLILAFSLIKSYLHTSGRSGVDRVMGRARNPVRTPKAVTGCLRAVHTFCLSLLSCHFD